MNKKTLQAARTHLHHSEHHQVDFPPEDSRRGVEQLQGPGDELALLDQAPSLRSGGQHRGEHGDARLLHFGESAGQRLHDGLEAGLLDHVLEQGRGAAREPAQRADHRHLLRIHRAVREHVPQQLRQDQKLHSPSRSKRTV